MGDRIKGRERGLGQVGPGYCDDGTRIDCRLLGYELDRIEFCRAVRMRCSPCFLLSPAHVHTPVNHCRMVPFVLCTGRGIDALPICNHVLCLSPFSVLCISVTLVVCAAEETKRRLKETRQRKQKEKIEGPRAPYVDWIIIPGCSNAVACPLGKQETRLGREGEQKEKMKKRPKGNYRRKHCLRRMPN